MAGRWLLLGALGGFLTVALGAFGAHGLEGRLTAQAMGWWHKAVAYQGLHALALLTCGLLGLHTRHAALSVAGWAFAAGILLFSGSLYLLALSGERWLGAVTPFGGTAFLVGWGALAVAALRLPRRP
jgi:uncharacterized membrane protein YgdD (TMEM256/DUF423 family)